MRSQVAQTLLGEKRRDLGLGDLGSIPGLGRSPGEGNGNPLQYSCLGNPIDGGTWWATVHRVTELDTTEQLHLHLKKKLHSENKLYDHSSNLPNQK